MAKWKLEEVSFNSLYELNQYIDEKNIEPENVLKYETAFDQIKQTMRYMITYWVKYN